MAAKMKTGRTVVKKTTTDPSKGEFSYTKMSKEDQYKDLQGKFAKFDTGARGIGKGVTHGTLDKEDLKYYQERERENMGHSLLVKGVRVDPSFNKLSREERRARMDKSQIGGLVQTEYYDPKKDKGEYEKESRAMPIPKMQTKKATTISTNTKAEIIKPKKQKVVKEKEREYVPVAGNKGVKFKKKASVTNRLRGTGTSVVANIKNAIGKAKFEKEKKQAKAGERALKTEGYAGSSSRERLATLKDVKSNLKEVKKAKMGVETKGALKDVRKGIRYEKKVIKGKNTY